MALNCLSKSLVKRSYLSCVMLIRLRLYLVGSCLTETDASLVLWLLSLELFGFVFLQAISYSVAFGVLNRQCTYQNGRSSSILSPTGLRSSVGATYGSLKDAEKKLPALPCFTQRATSISLPFTFTFPLKSG